MGGLIGVEKKNNADGNAVDLEPDEVLMGKGVRSFLRKCGKTASPCKDGLSIVRIPSPFFYHYHHPRNKKRKNTHSFLFFKLTYQNEKTSYSAFIIYYIIIPEAYATPIRNAMQRTRKDSRFCSRTQLGVGVRIQKDESNIYRQSFRL